MPKEDGIINWVEPKYQGYLPEDIDKDVLSVLIRLLIGKVKEDHAKMQYKKELKHYSSDICQIVKFARNNGYKKIDPLKSDFKDVFNRMSGNSDVSVKEDTIDTDSYYVKNTNGIIEDLSFLEEK